MITELTKTLIHSREADIFTLSQSCKNQCSFTIILCHVISAFYKSSFFIIFHVYFWVSPPPQFSYFVNCVCIDSVIGHYADRLEL